MIDQLLVLARAEAASSLVPDPKPGGVEVGAINHIVI
jgi:hypothetical protein